MDPGSHISFPASSSGSLTPQLLSDLTHLGVSRKSYWPPRFVPASAGMPIHLLKGRPLGPLPGTPRALHTHLQCSFGTSEVASLPGGEPIPQPMPQVPPVQTSSTSLGLFSQPSQEVGTLHEAPLSAHPASSTSEFLSCSSVLFLLNNRTCCSPHSPIPLGLYLRLFLSVSILHPGHHAQIPLAPGGHSLP